MVDAEVTVEGERFANLDDRRAYRAAQGRFFSAHREHGTLLSQPVFALAQLKHAIGVLPPTGATCPVDTVCMESLASW